MSGNGNHGTGYGITDTEDRFGEMWMAFSFDGDDDYIDIGEKGIFNFGTGDFTLEAWISMNPDASGPRHILGKRVEED